MFYRDLFAGVHVIQISSLGFSTVRSEINPVSHKASHEGLLPNLFSLEENRARSGRRTTSIPCSSAFYFQRLSGPNNLPRVLTHTEPR